MKKKLKLASPILENIDYCCGLGKMSAVKGQIVDEAVEDSLEFYIKFPKAMPTDNQPQEVSSSDNNFVFVFNEKNAPIILLLG